MTRISTFFYCIKKMVGFTKVKESNLLLKQGLAEEFEPSRQTVSNIMAFASAYHNKETKSIGNVDFILN